MEYIEIEFRSVENKEEVELNFWKHVDNTEKSKTITLCFVSKFPHTFQDLAIFYKLEMTQFLLNENEHTYWNFRR